MDHFIEEKEDTEIFSNELKKLGNIKKGREHLGEEMLVLVY